MTKRIDQASLGALVLQHHGKDDGYDVNSRSAVWAVRQITKRDDDHKHRVDYDTLGDVLCATVYQAPPGPITGAGRQFTSRELPAAWAFAWPTIVTQAAAKEKPSGDEDLGRIPGPGDDLGGGDFIDGTIGDTEDVFSDGEYSSERRGEESLEGETGPGDNETTTGERQEDPNYMGAAPIRRDDYVYDDRFMDGGHWIPEWRTPYPAGYIAISIGGTEEFDQERLMLSADDSIIAPNHRGPGIMGTLVHDLSLEGTVVRGAPPGVGDRAARFQTMGRVVRVKSLRKLNLAKPHNSLAWNLAPTGKDGDSIEGGRRSHDGFAGLGSVVGLVSISKADNDNKTDNPTTPDDDWNGGGQPGGGAQQLDIYGEIVGGVEGHLGGSGDGIQPGLRSAGDFDGGGGLAKGEKWPLAVAFAEKFAQGPFNVGFGIKDKHQHGMTSDGETIQPLHIDTQAYFIDRFDKERDAPLEFDPIPYQGGSDYALRAKVYLRYSAPDQHKFMDEMLPGLWRWETTVPYGGSRTPDTPDTPTTPDDPVPPPPYDPPPPTTPGDGPAPPPTVPAPPNPNEPGAPTTPPGSPGQPIPGGPTSPAPTPGSGGDNPWGGNPGAGVEPPAVPPSPGFNPPPVVPGGRDTPGYWGSFAFVRPYDHPSREVQPHTAFFGVTAFSDVLFRPQHATGSGADFRYGAHSPGAWSEEDSTKPAVLRSVVWGAEEDGAWDYTEDPGSSRHRGGTADGGLLFIPPETDLLDEADSFAPAGVTPSTGYVGAAPGVYFSAGDPELSSGDMVDDAWRWGQDASGNLVIQTKRSGVWTTAGTFSDDGTYTYLTVDHLQLAQPEYDDLRVSLVTAKVPGTKAPTWAAFKDDGGGSEGVYSYSFSATAEEMLFFEVQLPHSWSEATNILPHIHWCSEGTDTGDVLWRLEYTVQSINGTFGNTTILNVVDAADGTAFKHQVASWDPISMAGMSQSCVMICRVARVGDAGQDTCTDETFGLSVDFHYQKYRMGSKQEFSD